MWNVSIFAWAILRKRKSKLDIPWAIVRKNKTNYIEYFHGYPLVKISIKLFSLLFRARYSTNTYRR